MTEAYFDHTEVVAKVLDHGYVHMVDSMPAARGSGDDRIVQAARISMAHLPADVLAHLGLPATHEDRTPEQDVRLINYLLSNGHTTPFEKVRFEFVVKAPIFVARQWFRHRMGSFNEVSARYTQLPCEYYVPALDRMQAQSTSNKQASGEVLPDNVAPLLRSQIDAFSKLAYSQYESFLAEGLARELARMVLPTNFYTSWYWTVDLHNLMHFLKLRLHSHAQYEIRVYAEAMLPMVALIAPNAVAAFKHIVLKQEGA
jgi:thymidylate synthase (FAD)